MAAPVRFRPSTASVLLAVVVGIVCFVLGALVSRESRNGPHDNGGDTPHPDQPAALAPPTERTPTDGMASTAAPGPSPQIILDASSIQLLPDASLHLDLPRTPPTTPARP